MLVHELTSFAAAASPNSGPSSPSSYHQLSKHLRMHQARVQDSASPCPVVARLSAPLHPLPRRIRHHVTMAIARGCNRSLGMRNRRKQALAKLSAGPAHRLPGCSGQRVSSRHFSCRQPPRFPVLVLFSPPTPTSNPHSALRSTSFACSSVD
jgi:hypothetical protein